MRDARSRACAPGKCAMTGWKQVAEQSAPAEGAPTLADFLRTGFVRGGDRPSVTCVLPNGMAATMSYAMLDRQSDAVAAWLRGPAGLQAGDIVAIQAPNCLAFPVILYGIIKAGLVPTAINPLYTEREVVEQLVLSRAKLLFILDVLAGGGLLDGVLSRMGPLPVVTVSIADGFPLLQSLLIRLNLRYVRQVVKPVSAPVIPFSQVMRRGSGCLPAGGTGVYTAGTRPDDPASCWFTGGTTGRSKGVLHSNRSLLHSVGQIRHGLAGPWATEPLRTLLVLPFYHIFGVGMMLQAHDLSGHVIMTPNPRPLSNLQAAFEKFRPTFLPGVPTLFANLLEEPWFAEASKSLLLCVSGAAPLAPAVQARWRQVTGLPIHELYGMTESGLASVTPMDGGDWSGSIGRILPGLESRLVDRDGQDVPLETPGELLLRGPQIMPGYLNAREETARVLVDGWLHTGDICSRDAAGTLRIVDRSKDMILVSGFNVYPSEVEAALAEHPGVLESAVVGVPDTRTGEAVTAFIVPRHADVTIERLLAHCRTRLAPYKVPKRLILTAELPKTPVGKILKRTLRDRFVAQSADNTPDTP
jgi:long-chain acyl-CoA synthetase